MSEVFKFGGSTIKSASALEQIAQIILNSKNLAYVIVSATFNTTNELEEIAKAALQSECRANDLKNDLIEKHQKLIADLGLCQETAVRVEAFKDELNSYIKEIASKNEISKGIMDRVYSIGERYCSSILFQYLDKLSPNKFLHLDAREVITTNSSFGEATPLFGIIENKLKKYEQSRGMKTVITQGFIGQDQQKRTTILGREGSDYSASIFAWAIKASKIVIWKDVGGILSWDPKLKENPFPIKKLSFDEVNTLTYAGAKVLFHRTMYPLKERNIPLEIKGINAPEKIGTVISAESHGSLFGLVEVNDLNSQSLISLCGNNLIENKIIDDALIESINQNEIEVDFFSNNLLSVKTSLQKRSFVLNAFDKLILKANHL